MMCADMRDIEQISRESTSVTWEDQPNGFRVVSEFTPEYAVTRPGCTSVFCSAASDDDHSSVTCSWLPARPSHLA